MSRPTISKRMLLAAMVSLIYLTLACSPTGLLTALSGPPTATPTPHPTSTPASTSTPSLDAVITNAVMAKDAQGDQYDPVGITDTFPGNQSTFHAVVSITNAPDNTSFKVIWLTSSNTEMGNYNLQSGGTRNLDFTFEPDAGTLPAGDYHVEVYVNGDLNRTLKFSVSSSTSEQPTPEATQKQSSGFISDVVMAKGTEGSDKHPVDETNTFGTTDIFHAVVAIQDAPANTDFKATWYIVDAGSAAAPNSSIGVTELKTDGTRNVDFSLRPPSEWPVGSYRVDISVNGTVDTSRDFDVQ
ncbi:MAG: hypothetical protein M1482_03090 [Chloroflexi bacterium]|nr:hypothetical protein [Chloroflexota bacterium]